MREELFCATVTLSPSLRVFPSALNQQVVNVVVWSPCGKFLAAGTVGGTLCVWDVDAKLCIERYGGGGGGGRGGCQSFFRQSRSGAERIKPPERSRFGLSCIFVN